MMTLLVHGILLFRPLPGHLDEEAIKAMIHPEKDMDCMSPVNIAKVFAGDETGYAPCTAEAVVEMLDHYGIDVTGKRVTVVGRSMVVGKPLAMMLLKSMQPLRSVIQEQWNLQRLVEKLKFWWQQQVKRR